MDLSGYQDSKPPQRIPLRIKTVSMPDMSLGMNGLIADTNDFSNLNLNNLFNYRDYIMF